MVPKSGTDQFWGCQDIFRSLPEDHRSALVRAAEPVPFVRRQYLCREEDPQGGLWIIGSGYVLQTRAVPAKGEATVGLAGPGQLFGLLSMEGNRLRGLDTRGITSGLALRIPRQTVADLKSASPEFAALVSQHALKRLDSAYEALSEMSYERVEQRILAALLRVAEDYGSFVDDRVWVGVPLTRQEVADLAQTTVETVIRTLRKWEHSGCLTTVERQITLSKLSCLRSSVLAPKDALQ